jgi:predicted enzyme related to lactoylglutathione lyase
MNGVVHIELPTPDLEKSKAFYSAVFGWEVTAFPGGEFCMWRAPDGPGGGFMKGVAVPEAGPIIYIEVEDMPATLAKAGESGGSTLKGRTEIGGGMGFYALLADNVGNRIGIWTRG